MSKKKKIIMMAVSILCVLVVSGMIIATKNKAKAAADVKTQALTKTNLQRVVEADGIIGSTVIEQVANSSGIPVWDVDVAVGSYVNRGDRLARLHVEGNDQWERVNATIAGTITAVYAVNGAPANGVLFTIQNTNSLKVDMKLKEADVSKVSVGMPVTIKTEATGDREYTGSVTSIAPAAATASAGNSEGQVAAAQKVEFIANVRIESPIDGLLIGMKSKQKIVVEQKEGVFAVPFDAIVKDEQGNLGVMTAKADDKGVFKAEWIPVTTGIQNDFAIEISGEGLSEGLQILMSPEAVKTGDALKIADTEGGANGQQ